MANIKLELNDFIHKSSDDNTTTLEHKKHKHTITLAHKFLSDDNKKQLEALAKASKPKDKKEADVKMAEGGLLDKAGKALDSLADNASGESNKPFSQQNRMPAGERTAPAPDPAKIQKYGIDKAFNPMAQGGEVQKFAEGTPDETIQAPNLQPDDLKFDPYKATHAPTPQERLEAVQANPQELDRIATAGQMFDMDTQPPPEEKERMALQEVAKENTIRNSEAGWRAQEASPEAKQQAQLDALRMQAGLPVESKASSGSSPIYNKDAQGNPIQPQAAQEVNPQLQGIAQGQQQIQNPQLQDMGTAEGMLKSGFQHEMAGIQGLGKAQADLGIAQAKLLDQAAQQQSEAKATYVQKFGELEKERQSFMQDIKDGHIDPELYWKGDKDGNGSHSKILTGIGMILAGFNPAGGPNGAVEFLNAQMERNINAQKANLDSKNNLLRANLQQFGNLKDATDMTRVMQASMVVNQLQQAAATAQNPMAKAAALQAAGKVEKDYFPSFQQLSMRRSMMSLANDPNGPKDGAIQQMIQYKRAMGDHAGAKELEEHYVPGVGYSPNQAVPQPIREKLIAHQEMDKQLKDLHKFVTTHNTLIPGTPDYNVGQQKAMALQTMIREGMLNTVYREGEQPLLDKMINSNPAGMMKMLKTVPQIGELTHQNEMKFNTLKKAYGLPVTQPQQEISQPIKGKDGRMYIQQGKYMIPVK